VLAQSTNWKCITSYIPNTEEITDYNISKNDQATAPKTLHSSASEQSDYVLGKCADQASNQENRVTEQNYWLSAPDVA
jgi:hypothetical protein